MEKKWLVLMIMDGDLKEAKNNSEEEDLIIKIKVFESQKKATTWIQDTIDKITREEGFSEAGEFLDNVILVEETPLGKKLGVQFSKK